MSSLLALAVPNPSWPTIDHEMSDVTHENNTSPTPENNEILQENVLEHTSRSVSTPISQPNRSRKRKAPTQRASNWEPHKARIIELHVDQGKPLREVRQIIEDECGFSAEIRQYRTRISQWGKDKNIKTEEMRAIVRKQQYRKLVDRNKPPLAFTVRNTAVEPDKISRWMKRNNISESQLYGMSPTPSTPPDVDCRTVSDMDSPTQSRASSPASEEIDPESRYYDSNISPVSSSASSDKGAVISPDRKFAGQSPSLSHRPLATVAGGVPSSVPYRNDVDVEDISRQDLHIAQHVFGHKHPTTLRHLRNLCEVLLEQGRMRSAENMARQLVAYRGGGVFTPDMMQDHTLLDKILFAQGHYADVEVSSRIRLSISQRLFGLGHPITLDVMYVLVAVRRAQARIREAEELCVDLIDLSKAVHGVDDPITLRCMSEMAKIRISQGRILDAKILATHIFDLDTNLLGPEHTDTLDDAATMVRIFMEQGCLNGAKELGKDNLKVYTRVMGEEHPDTLYCMHQLGAIFFRLSQFSDMISIMEKCINGLRKVLGPGHPTTLNAKKDMENWGRMLSEYMLHLSRIS